MGKKKTRSSMTSKGERRSISKSATQLVRRGRTDAEKLMNKIDAWRAGKNPWITVSGPSTDKRFVRVRANNIYGDPKRVRYGNIFHGKTEE